MIGFNWLKHLSQQAAPLPNQPQLTELEQKILAFCQHPRTLSQIAEIAELPYPQLTPILAGLIGKLLLETCMEPVGLYNCIHYVARR